MFPRLSTRDDQEPSVLCKIGAYKCMVEGTEKGGAIS
jgi:hypothetical protein